MGSNFSDDPPDSNPAEESQAEDPPITPETLGLPKGYDHDQDAKHIPTQGELRAAAVRALDEWTAFVLLHRDDPARIVEHLDSIAQVVLAASQVKGDHQAKAIRLGLALEPEYWFGADKINHWLNLIIPLIGTALEISARELQSELYRAWGVYLFLTRSQPRSAAALEKALIYADTSGRDDLRILARVERFNIHAGSIALEEATAEAEALLTNARRLGYTYAQGRVYLSLARACNARLLHCQTFHFAQQAMLLLAHLDVHNLAGQAATLMLCSLPVGTGLLSAYRRELLAVLSSLARRSTDPWFRAATLHLLATEDYYSQRYETAREYALNAWRGYRRIGQPDNCNRIRQILGLVQIKRRRWLAAERHLRATRDYAHAGNQVALAVNAQHALAFIPLEQGDYASAHILLLEALRRAEAVPDDAARQQAVDQVRADVLKVEQRLSETK